MNIRESDSDVKERGAGTNHDPGMVPCGDGFRAADPWEMPQPVKAALPPKESTSLATRVLVSGQTIEIPPGYKLAKGACQIGDMHLSAYLFATTGRIEWLPVKPEHCTGNEGEIYCGADWYELLIRPVPRITRER